MSGENKRPQCVKALPFKPNNPSMAATSMAEGKGHLPFSCKLSSDYTRTPTHRIKN